MLIPFGHYAPVDQNMRIEHLALAMVAAAGCARGGDGGGGGGGETVDGSCGDQCDSDSDGVSTRWTSARTRRRARWSTAKGALTRSSRQSSSPTFPPYNLMWTSGGDIGRPGGLTWTYEGIQRGDLFHIYWIICDDPLQPCGISLDGPIDKPSESWKFSATDSDLPAGKVVFTNITAIALDGGSSQALDGRLTIRSCPRRTSRFRSDRQRARRARACGCLWRRDSGTGYKVAALIEVRDTSGTWTPYLDYYDAAPTPMMGGSTSVSFGASFYSK